MFSSSPKRDTFTTLLFFPIRDLCNGLDAVFQNIKEGLGDEILVNEEIPSPLLKPLFPD